MLMCNLAPACNRKDCSRHKQEGGWRDSNEKLRSGHLDKQNYFYPPLEWPIMLTMLQDTSEHY
jgi:hypothetical protein